MKKIISLLLTLVLILGLVACGQPAAEQGIPPMDVEAPTAPATRKDLEDAIAYSALAYYLKDMKMQYCGFDMNEAFSKYFGSDYRVTEFASPEYGTEHQTIFSVCSAYTLQTYFEAIGKRLFNNPNYIDNNTDCLWYFSETQPEALVPKEDQVDMCLLRCWTDYKLTSSDKKFGVTEKHRMTVEETRAFLQDWENNLRAGDIFVAEGHALLYVGNGFVLDVGGKTYDEANGREPVEYRGAVAYLHTVESLFLDGGDFTTGDYYLIDEKFGLDTNGNGKASKDDGDGPAWFTVLRPLDAYVVFDSDNDLSNDLAKDGNPMAAKVATRMAYPGIEIDRGMEGLTPYNTFVTGQKVTYRVKVTNKSNEEAVVRFETARNASYQPAPYSGIRVEEVIPAGTELVSVSKGGYVENGRIYWIMDDIAPGEVGTVSFTVKVTAKMGETVTAEGGFVSYIPTPDLKNMVGGAKIKDSATKGLAEFASAGVGAWREKYNISRTATGLAFAERVYAKAMGIELNLPTVEEIVGSLYTWEKRKLDRLSVRSNDPKIEMVLVPKENPTECADITAMLKLGYEGGDKLFYPNAADRLTNINEFKCEFLEPGDILVYANLNGTKVANHRVMIYTGNDTIVSLESDGRATVIGGADAKKLLYRAFVQDVFFMLRPTLITEDLNKSSYKGQEPAYGEEPVDVTYSAPLSDAAKQAISALTVDDVSSLGRNTAFAEKVYQKIGLDFSGITKSLTQMNVMEKLSGKFKIGTVNYYDSLFENPNAVGKMLLGDYMGGTRVVNEGGKVPTVDVFEVGDVLNLGNNSNGTYWTAVYQGDGNFLFACWDGKGTENYYQILTFDDAALAELLQKHPTNGNEWLWTYILRPSLAYNDINTEAVK